MYSYIWDSLYKKNGETSRITVILQDKNYFSQEFDDLQSMRENIFSELYQKYYRLFRNKIF